MNGYDALGRDPRYRSRRYPIRFLRYWYVRHMLEEQAARLGRPISVLEVGIGGGHMPAFLGGRQVQGLRRERPDWISRWDGLDVVIETAASDHFAYSDFIEANVEKPIDPSLGRYDAIVLCHVLEHLVDPEAAMQRLRGLLNADGVLIGGSPTMPSSIAALYQPWLRWKFRALIDDLTTHRHLSVMTPRRIRRFARTEGMAVELLAGTFFCRWSGLFLEDTEWWTRANLTWGALFPALGGEVYFLLRQAKAVRDTAGAPGGEARRQPVSASTTAA
jgi:2-polyprenyl-3-methyl-5-hydroxy-6-metoxy-1,4-benzoquinol methylase